MEKVEVTKRDGVGLLAIGQNDLLVCTTYDLPQTWSRWMRPDEVAGSICVLTSDFRVCNRKREFWK